MAFLESLDIDGVSEHSQLFRLESEQVSRLLRESVRKRVEDMDFGRLLRGEGDSGSELGEELSDAIEEAMREGSSDDDDDDDDDGSCIAT